MTRKERFGAVVEYFRREMPAAQTELSYDSPFGLLVAVMLSAQCTDRRVNMVTPELMKSFPSPEAMAGASFEDVYSKIRSISYPNAKARHIIKAATMIADRFGGELPGDTGALMTLPGVGRKTANVVASIIYNEPVIAVDTHVFRVSHRLGLSDGRTPEDVEKDLERHISESDRPLAHHWFILHGRYVCKAKSPACGECGLKECCREFTNGRGKCPAR